MKILIFTGVPLDDAASFYRVGLLARLLQGQNHEIKVLSVSGNFRREEKHRIDALEVLFIGQAHYQAKKTFANRQKLNLIKSLIYNLQTCWRFANYLRQEKPDRVLIVTTMPISLMSGLTSRLLGFRTLLDIEDYALGQMLASGYPRVLVIFYSLVEKLGLRSFHKVCVCSRFLQEKYPGATIIPNMIETKSWKSDQVKNNDGKTLAFVGQIGLYHGQLEILENLVTYLNENKTVRLIFVGGGECLEKLRSKIKHFKLEKQVFLTGQVNQKKVREILQDCQVGLLPLWNTPVHQARHPLKLLEYLAAGLVVLTNDVGEASKIIANGQNGFLLKAGDLSSYYEQIEKIFADDKLRQQISQEAQKTAQKYDVSVVFPLWLEFLK